eukprot:2660149-Rhodomonas_salina.1
MQEENSTTEASILSGQFKQSASSSSLPPQRSASLPPPHYLQQHHHHQKHHHIRSKITTIVITISIMLTVEFDPGLKFCMFDFAVHQNSPVFRGRVPVHTDLHTR